MSANHDIGTDLNVARQFSMRIDDRGGMNLSQLRRPPYAIATSMAEISACAATLPSTLATPCIFQ